MKTRLFILASFLLSGTFVWADKVTVDGAVWHYDVLSAGEVALTESSGGASVTPSPVGALTIPSQLGGLSVVELGESAFEGCTGLTSVVIGPTVRAIGEKAFRDCTSLRTIELANGDVQIAKGAFRGCTALTTFEIPSGMTEITEEMLRDCRGLTSVVIPLGVTSIGEGAFRDCSGLQSIELPSTVTNISARAFEGCSGLTTLVIPEGVTRIGDKAFRDCAGLVNVVLSKTVSYLGDDVFDGCVAIENIEVDEANEWYEVVEDTWKDHDVWALCGTENAIWVRKFRWPRAAGVHRMQTGTYTGLILDAEGQLSGSLMVKVSSSSKDQNQIVVTIQMAGETRKVTVKGVLDETVGRFSLKASGGRLLTLNFPISGGMRGTFDGQTVEGTYNYLLSTQKSSARTAAEAVLGTLKGSYTLACKGESGWGGLNVTIGSKGKVKVSGTLADKTKITTTSQLTVGDASCWVPVIYTKKTTRVAFYLVFANDGSETAVVGLGDEVVMSPVGALGSGLSFTVDPSVKDLFAGYSLCTKFLPVGVGVSTVGNRWVVANRARAGRIRLVNGQVVDQLASLNPSGLTLTSTARTGSFRGSFKLYAVDGRGRLKTFRATLTGVVVDGKGYGTATITGRGACAVTIGE